MTLELDVHGYSVEQAIYAIQRTIVANPKCNCLEIIHGYNNGRKLKEALMNKINIHNKRVLKTCPVPFNNGRTFEFLDVSLRN